MCYVDQETLSSAVSACFSALTRFAVFKRVVHLNQSKLILTEDFFLQALFQKWKIINFTSLLEYYNFSTHQLL